MKKIIFLLIILSAFTLQSMNDTQNKKYVRHFGFINSLTFSPNQKQIAAEKNSIIIKIWDHENQQCVQELRPENIIGTVKYITTDDNEIQLITIPSINIFSSNLEAWNPENGSLITKYENYSNESGVDALCNAGIYCLHTDHTESHPLIWKIPTTTKILSINNEENESIYSLSFSNDTKSCALGSDKEIKIFDIEANQEIITFKENLAPHFTVQFSPNNKRIASGLSSRIQLYDTCSKKVTHQLLFEDLVTAVAFSPDDNLLSYATKEDEEVHYLDMRNYQELF